MKKPKVILAACYLTQERDQCFNSGLYLLRSQCLQPRDHGNIVCHRHFECSPDPSVGATQMPLLHKATLGRWWLCLWFLQHTYSLSWHLPQGARTVALQARVSSIPGGARLLCAGPCFLCLPSQTPPLTNEPKPLKSEISVFIIKQGREPEHQEVKNMGREGAFGFLCVNHSLPITSNPCKIWRNHLRVCFGSIRETPKPQFWKGFKHSPDELSFQL